jgi:Spy/CpxP family protein refolding chaperone
MWGMTKPLLVLLSVVLNSAFVAAWLSHRLPGENCAGKLESCCILSTVEATPQQREQMLPRLADFRKRSKEQCQEINRLRRELIDLLEEDQPDRQAVAGKQQEILEGQRKMQQMIVDELLAEKSILKPEQQKKFFELIRKRCGCGSGGKEIGLHEPPEREPGDCRLEFSRNQLLAAHSTQRRS